MLLFISMAKIKLHEGQTLENHPGLSYKELEEQGYNPEIHPWYVVNRQKTLKAAEEAARALKWKEALEAGIVDASAYLREEERRAGTLPAPELTLDAQGQVVLPTEVSQR